jgi:hypothetical protein
MKLKRFEQLRLQDNREATKREVKQMTAVIDGGFTCRKILDLELGQMADAERHLADFDYSAFCRIFVKRKWYKPFRISHMTAIISEFKVQKDELREMFSWVFDPPSYGEPAKETVGSDLRNEFVNEFGNYVVLTDLLVSKTGLSYKEIERWSVEDFFFWANYYSGQKIVANVK